jgi:hypothetical protein
MIKQIALLSRRATIARQEFRKAATSTTGLFLASSPQTAATIRHCHYTFFLPGAASSVVGHSLATRLDLIAEIYYAVKPESDVATRPAPHSPIDQLIKGRLADATAVTTLNTKEWPVLRGERTDWRVFCLRRRTRALSRVEFQERWLRNMRELLEKRSRPSGLAGYVQNLTMEENTCPDDTDSAQFDVIDEFFLNSPTVLGTLYSSRSYLLVPRSLEEELLDPGSTKVFVGETVRIIP